MRARLTCSSPALSSDAALPYDLPSGGSKQSGTGRELGLEGLQEWTETKTVMITVEGLDAIPGAAANGVH